MVRTQVVFDAAELLDMPIGFVKALSHPKQISEWGDERSRRKPGLRSLRATLWMEESLTEEKR